MSISSLHKKQIKLLLSTWAVISILFSFQITVTGVLGVDSLTGVQIFQYIFGHLISGFLLTIGLVIPTYNSLKRVIQPIRVFGLSIAGILYGIGHPFFFRLITRGLDGSLNFSQLLTDTANDHATALYHYITYYLVFIAILVAIDYLQAKHAAVASKEHIEKELAETKLSVLRNQLQPHFLFNALNSISSIIDDNKEASQDMIADLSHLLRNSLQTDFSQRISLEEELIILNSYLNIEKRRFEHQLIFEESIHPETLLHPVLPFMLQPLVENAIKHGFSSGISKLKIKIDALFQDNYLVVRVANNGAPLAQDAVGVGIQNLKERLVNGYNQNFQFILEQREEWVVNEVKLKLS